MRPPLPRIRRAIALATTTFVAASLLAAASTGVPVSSATAAEESSALTVPLTNGYPVAGAYLTVSKTKNLVDGEQITISGLLRERPAGGGGKGGAFVQTGTAYGPHITQLTDTPSVRGTKTAYTPEPEGWGVGRASWVTATITVHSGFTTPTSLGNTAESASPAGITYDCLVEQCYLALGQGVWNNGSVDFAVSSAYVEYVPISFAGGNPELVTDVAPSFTATPQNAFVADGETAEFTASATGRPEPTVRWQSSGDDGLNWADVEGATGETLSVVAAGADDGRLYRAVASSRQGEVVSPTVVLSVVRDPEAGDDGRWPLYNPGSWARVSQTTGLVDGQSITLEADYSLETSSNPDFPPRFPLPTAQTRSDASGDHREAPAVWVTAAPTGNDRYRGTVDYTVRSSLTDPVSGETTDCLATQCYLVVGGIGKRADGSEYGYRHWGFVPEWEPETGYASDLAYVTTGPGSTVDNWHSIYIPLYFEGGSLAPRERSVPAFTTHPVSVETEENTLPTLSVEATGFPAPDITWQRSLDGGQTWFTIGGATGATYAPFAIAALNKAQYRAVATNALGATPSEPATLTVVGAPETAGTGVTLDWTGNSELQGLTPARTPNYFSAGSSDGTRATYQNTADNVIIVRRTAAGSEVAASYDTRAFHATEGGSQTVRLSNGVADLDHRGVGTIEWDASWTVNFYGGFVPFTITDPTLTIAADGTGTLTADLSGYASSMDDPTTKVELDPVEDVVVSTFSSVALAGAAGNQNLTVQPDFAGVEVEVSAEHAPQLRTVSGWGSWPQSFVDFQASTGLSSYWYTSGGSADILKAPRAFTVRGLTLPPAPVAPSAPREVSAAANGAGTLGVTWVAPVSDGGSAITGYRVDASSGGEVVASATADATARNAELTGLAAATDYSVTVVAISEVGESAASAPVDARTFGVPSAPSAPALAADDRAATATWSAPASDGGTPVTSYSVELVRGGEVVATLETAGGDEGSLEVRFTGLERGAEYTARVIATNLVGDSAASAESAAVTIVALAPEAPAAPTATATSPTSVDVAWAAPADNGSAITGYTVTLTGGSEPRSIDTETLSAPVTGLEPGTEYSATVVAHNAIGTSAESPAADVTTPATVPGGLAAPTVTATGADSLHVAWAPATDDGGAPITAQRVRVFDGETVVQTVDVSADASSTDVSGLEQGRAYTVTVAAVNATGEGAPSPASAPVSTLDVPAPVLAPVLALSGEREATATWSSPASDGGSAITGYVVTLVGADGAIESRTVTDTSAVFSGLARGAAHTVTVAAVNAIGAGPAVSSEELVVPAVAPSAPDAPVIARFAPDALTVGWNAPADDGGAPVTGYRVVVVGPGGAQSFDAPPGVRTFAVSALAAGVYTAAVVAVNAAGESGASPASAVVDLAGPAPAAEPDLAGDALFANPSATDIRLSIADGRLVVDLGEERSDEWVGFSVHSTPRFAGWVLTDAAGGASTALPAGLGAGAHHVVVYDADGGVIGYASFEIAEAPTGQPGGDPSVTVTNPSGRLSATGVEPLGATLAAGILLALGLALAATRRRRRV
ncbi:fibronectin type III domain-containing protein [Agromyces atrinae]|uniref:fibronectin type III domain-containing protein n=1 Tax=Agromyces atrinae TaxID=592376 RepID=UPI001F55DB73|nr:fibronectin type III domain-containing protein [Agromyces atrinae]MCI2957496.1 fibronectin type III domain-containing protein [Agromyces atrinae]